MNVQTMTLGNGLTVVFEPDQTIETVVVLLMFRGGSAFEANNIGAAHFFEHVVFDGTEGFPSKRDLKGLVESIGGSANGMTGRDSVHYFVEAMPKDFAQICQYLSEITIRPLLRQDDVAKEIKIVGKEIQRYIDDPKDYSGEGAQALIYPNQVAGRCVLGTRDDLFLLNRDCLWQFLRTHYVGQNGVLVVRGNIGDTEIDQLEKYFGSMSSGSRQELPTAVPSHDKVAKVENRLGLTQCHFRVRYPAFLGNDERRYHVKILNNILGAGSTSRLMYRMREEENLIYSLDGRCCLASGSQGYLGTGSSVDEGSLNRALAIINEEMLELATHKVDEPELRRAINYSLVGRSILSQSNKEQAREYAYDQLFYGAVKCPKEETARLEAVTAEQVRSAAEQLLRDGAKLFVLTPTLTQEDIVF